MPQDVHSLEGHLLADKYRVERVLGEGGMGRVLLAFHTGLAQRVAVKLLHTELARRDQTATERFKREAHTSARIRHEHVCRVLDAGTLSDGTPYLAMEYLEGKDLGEELAIRGRLPLAEAVLLLRQACEGVQEAHRLGIVHRDLKPQNLFLAQTEEGALRLKVLDFGISKAHVDDAGGKLTRTSSLVGSPLYMSPEQLHADKSLDGRADIWALGCILYELIAGRPPFVGESMPQLVHAVLHMVPPSFASLGITVPGGFDAIVSKALSKDRDHRFGSARELADALLPYAPTADTLASGPRARTPEPYVAVPALAGSSAPSGAGTPNPVAMSVSAPGAIGDASAAGTPAPAPARGIRAPRALRWAALGFCAVVGALLLAMMSRKGGGEPAIDQREQRGSVMGSSDASTAPVNSVPAPPAPRTASVAPEPAPVSVVEAAEPSVSTDAGANLVPEAAVANAVSNSEHAKPPRTWTRPAAPVGAATLGRSNPPPVAAAAAAAEPAPAPAPDKSSQGLPSFGGRR